MFSFPIAISKDTLSKEDIRKDKATIEKFEDCALGKDILYLGTFGFPRVRYIPLTSVNRVYKRLAVSKGFFEQGKIYGSLSYLVVMHDDKETVIRFTHEENLDALLSRVQSLTNIPVGKPLSKDVEN